MTDELRPGNCDWDWRRKFVSDVFHTLAQPLTTLHCQLELALRLEPDLHQQRAALEKALKLTADVLASARLVRRLAEAGDPGQAASVPLAWAVNATIEEFKPVAEAQGGCIKAILDDTVCAWIDPGRLREALFHLMDQVLQSAGNRDVRIKGTAKDGYAVLTIASTGCRSMGHDDRWELSRGVALADRIIKAANGNITEQRTGGGIGFEVTLPMTRRAIKIGCKRQKLQGNRKI